MSVTDEHSTEKERWKERSPPQQLWLEKVEKLALYFTWNKQKLKFTFTSEITTPMARPPIVN